MPQLPIPAATGDVWGNTLNNFLKQVQSETDGSLNFAAARPTGKTVGYTMVDTTTRELIRFNATGGWDVLMGGQANGIESLTADREFWVATNGNDSNPGTNASPFLTIQKAIDTLYQKINANGFNVTIKLKPGTYPPQRVLFSGLPIGETMVNLEGTGANPSDTILQTSNDFRYSVNAANSASLMVRNLKLQKTGTFTGSNTWAGGLAATTSAYIAIENIEFGDFELNSGYSGFHIYAGAGGKINVSATNYNVSGGAAWHYFSQDTGSIICGYVPAVTVTVLGNNVRFSSGVYSSGIQGIMLLGSVNWINKASVTTPISGRVRRLGYLDGLTNANIPGTATWNVDTSGFAE